MAIAKKSRKQWAKDCDHYQGRLLDPDGKFAHWCHDWDGMPLDDTCGEEWACCTCFPSDSAPTPATPNSERGE